MSQILTILFDLDGTIVDTAPDLMAAHNHVMRKFGKDEKNATALHSQIRTAWELGLWLLASPSSKTVRI